MAVLMRILYKSKQSLIPSSRNPYAGIQKDDVGAQYSGWQLNAHSHSGSNPDGSERSKPLPPGPQHVAVKELVSESIGSVFSVLTQ